MQIPPGLEVHRASARAVTPMAARAPQLRLEQPEWRPAPAVPAHLLYGPATLPPRQGRCALPAPSLSTSARKFRRGGLPEPPAPPRAHDMRQLGLPSVCACVGRSCGGGARPRAGSEVETAVHGRSVLSRRRARCLTARLRPTPTSAPGTRAHKPPSATSIAPRPNQVGSITLALTGWIPSRFSRCEQSRVAPKWLHALTQSPLTGVVTITGSN